MKSHNRIIRINYFFIKLYNRLYILIVNLHKNDYNK